MSTRGIWILLAVFVGAALAIVVVVIALAGNNEGRLQEVAAWSTFAAAMANVLLLAGAVAAALGLREQIAEARRSREDSFRPVVQVFKGSTTGVIHLHVRNIGPGPALNLELEAWERDAETPEPSDDSRGYRDFLAEERRNVNAAGPELGGRLDLLGSGREEEVGLWSTDEPDFTSSAISGRVYYRLNYEDIFGKKFRVPALEVGVSYLWFFHAG